MSPAQSIFFQTGEYITGVLLLPCLASDTDCFLRATFYLHMCMSNFVYFHFLLLQQSLELHTICSIKEGIYAHKMYDDDNINSYLLSVVSV